MSFPFSDFAAQIKASHEISADDVLALRRSFWADGVISKEEAEALFALNDLEKTGSSEWVDFFIEALTDYTVNQARPKGYVSGENATWLMNHIDQDGRVETSAELELIVKILETANNAPNSLKAYAIQQIENVVVSGSGATRDGEAIRPGTIDECEVKLLRSLIFAQSSSGPASVSEDEAEMLFRIKQATLGADNGPGWQMLFVQGIANFLMAHTSYKPIDRDEAVRLETFMNDTSVNLGGFLSRMLSKPDFGAAKKVLFDHDDNEEIAARDAAIAADAEVTATENAWLQAHMDLDGQLDPLEQALVKFLSAG